MDRGKIPGLSVTIVKNDETVYQVGFGYDDMDLKKKVDFSTLFEIGSNSKEFTALGVLSLEKQEKINLNDNVSKYVTWIKFKYEDRYVDITLKELLHHTSGIPFRTIDKIPASNDEKYLEETVKTLVDIELNNEPGKVFEYATINYDVLGLIIEQVTGMSYEKYMNEEVLGKLGLNNTYVYKSGLNIENISKGYMISFSSNEHYR